MKKPRIIILANYVFQPRVIRRIETLQEQGYDLEVYGIGRSKYRGALSFSYQDILSKKDGSGYVRALVGMFLFVRSLLKSTRKENPVFYCFGIISALPLFFNFMLFPRLRVKFIYEISDIAYAPNKFRGFRKSLRWLDKQLIRSSALTILTSQGFARYIGFDGQSPKVLYLPNKVNAALLASDDQKTKKSSRKGLRFGFVGAMRSFDTIGRFAKVIGARFPEHEFHFHGFSHDSSPFRQLADHYSNIFYWGEFQNNKDLPRIYSGIDVGVACYDWRHDDNERYLEPNKLYEALFFRTPLIVSDHTYLADRVREFGCGFAINAYSERAIETFVNSLDEQTLMQKMKVLDAFPKASAVDDPSLLRRAVENLFQVPTNAVG